MSAVAANWREDFLAALGFLTRLPVARWSRREGTADVTTIVTLATASWAFPLVGVLVGIIGGIVYMIALSLGLPALADALLAVGATALATGGLHEDGLADSADGFGGGASREEKLAIMRDSRTGAYGALALVFSVTLRMAALNQIAESWHVLAALVAAHALARGVLPVILRLLEPARSDGLGAGAGRPGSNLALIACGTGLAVALLCTGLRAGLVASFSVGVVAFIMAWFAQRQIGGYTGDTLGAIEQGCEIAALLAIASWSP